MWRRTKLGDILKTGAGGTPLKSKKEFYEGGDIKWLLSGAVCERDIHDSKTYITQAGLDNSSAKVFPKNTVLIAMYGATAGQVGILRTEAATNQAVCGIYPSNDYLPEFLYYYFTNYKETLLLEVSGVAQPNLSQVKIKNIPIPVMTLDEQQRIVEKLDAAFAEIENCIAKTHKQSADILSFAYRSIDNCLTALQEKFKIVAIKDAVTIQPSKKLALRNLKDDDAVSFMGMDMLGVQKKYSEPNEDRILEDVFKAYQYFENNDVLFAKITPCFENGKLGIIRGLTNSVGFGSSEFVVFRPNRHITSDFVYYCLLAEKFRKDGAENMSGAVGHKRVTKEYFTNYLIPLPPIKVQLETVQRLDNLWRSSLEISQIKIKKYSKLFYLKSAILAQELQPPQSEAA